MTTVILRVNVWNRTSNLQIEQYFEKFTEALEVFSDVTPHDSRCDGRVWAALIKTNPPDSASIRNKLLMCELSRALCLRCLGAVY
jgi:hypothetical protein